jgi:hypothetical protein
MSNALLRGRLVQCLDGLQLQLTAASMATLFASIVASLVLVYTSGHSNSCIRPYQTWAELVPHSTVSKILKAMSRTYGTL